MSCQKEWGIAEEDWSKPDENGNLLIPITVRLFEPDGSPVKNLPEPYRSFRSAVLAQGWTPIAVAGWGRKGEVELPDYPERVLK